MQLLGFYFIFLKKAFTSSVERKGQVMKYFIEDKK